MDLPVIYQCFSDPTRLRLLHLLGGGPLCVCHFQELLGEPQVKISKHLGYLKTRGLVEATREGNWVVYRLPADMPAALRGNLACLRESVRRDPVFRRDAARLRALRPKLERSGPLCAGRSRTCG